LEKRANINGKFYHIFNGRILSVIDYHNRLEMCGIQPSNTFNFSLQNSIKRLTSLPKAGLLDVLSEVVGTKIFDRNKN
jgi:chromosome segregation ATPase